jgi:hypothetical protein
MAFYKFSITRTIYLKQFVKFLPALLLLQESDYYTPLIKIGITASVLKTLNWLWLYFKEEI